MLRLPTLALRTALPLRAFSTTPVFLAGSTGAAQSVAVVYAEHGDPKAVLQGREYQVGAVRAGEVRVRFERSAVNPADINVIQGVYPAKPVVRDGLVVGEKLSIMGNEASAVVEGYLDRDKAVEGKFKIGDRVVMGGAQLGTWQTLTNLPASSLIPISSTPPLSPAQLATLSINPPTALRMLSDFVPLNPATPNYKAPAKKQWVIQNGANSAVGISAIQLCREWGVGTVNLVRSRDNIDELKAELTGLGADHVMTYDEFCTRDGRAQVKEWTAGGELRLGLNCVGGRETTEMVKCLGMGGYLVTYGGMAKEPLKIPPGLFIFKKLNLTGFWLSDWVKRHPAERLDMMNHLAQLMADGKLKAPEVDEVDLSGLGPDEVGERVRGVMERGEKGRTGRKVVLRFSE